MAITDLRFAANLLKEGFSADEVRSIIGMKKQEVEQPPIETPPADGQDDETPAPDEPAPDPDTDPEPEPEEQDPEPEEPEKPNENPLTRNETPKKDTLIDTLAKLL